MALYVQVEDAKTGKVLHHVVTAFETVDDGPAGGSSRDFKRSYSLGCGKTVVAGGDRLAEAATPPWTNRHVAKGCFDTAADEVPGKDGK